MHRLAHIPLNALLAGVLLTAGLPASAQSAGADNPLLQMMGIDKLVAESPARASAASAIPLTANLSIVSLSSGRAGEFKATQRITAVTPRVVKLSYSAQRPNGSAVSASRSVRIEDLQTAASIRPNYVDGANEFFSGSTAFGTSTRVLNDLKASGRSELAIDAGGIGNGAGVQSAGLARELDGMLGDLGGFAGIADALERQAASGTISEQDRAEGAATLGQIDALQMLGGTLRLLRKDKISVQVNGKSRTLPAVVATGELRSDDESYPVELTILDDPGNPLLLVSRIGPETVRVLSIDYPQ